MKGGKTPPLHIQRFNILVTPHLMTSEPKNSSYPTLAPQDNRTLSYMNQTLNYTSLSTTIQSLMEQSTNSSQAELTLEVSGKQRRNVEINYSIYEDSIKLDELWEIAQSNQWFEWAVYTTAEIKKKDCLFCTKTPMSQVVVVPNPYTYEHCAHFNRDFCHMEKDLRLFCPAECLGSLSHSKHHLLFKHVSILRSKCRSFGISEKLKVQTGPVEIPLWYTVHGELG